MASTRLVELLEGTAQFLDTSKHFVHNGHWRLDEINAEVEREVYEE